MADDQQPDAGFIGELADETNVNVNAGSQATDNSNDDEQESTGGAVGGLTGINAGTSSDTTDTSDNDGTDSETGGAGAAVGATAGTNDNDTEGVDVDGGGDTSTDKDDADTSDTGAVAGAATGAAAGTANQKSGDKTADPNNDTTKSGEDTGAAGAFVGAKPGIRQETGGAGAGVGIETGVQRRGQSGEKDFVQDTTQRNSDAETTSARERITQRGPLDDLDRDKGVVDQFTDIFQDQNPGQTGLVTAVQDTGEEITEFGTELMMTGSQFGEDVQKWYRDTLSIIPAPNIAKDISSYVTGGAATVGTQAGGFFTGGAGGLLYQAGEAVDQPIDTVVDTAKSAAGFTALTGSQLAKNPVQFIAEESGEEIGEAAVGAAAFGLPGALFGALPTPEPELEPKPENLDTATNPEQSGFVTEDSRSTLADQVPEEEKTGFNRPAEMEQTPGNVESSRAERTRRQGGLDITQRGGEVVPEVPAEQFQFQTGGGDEATGFGRPLEADTQRQPNPDQGEPDVTTFPGGTATRPGDDVPAWVENVAEKTGMDPATEFEDAKPPGVEPERKGTDAADLRGEQPPGFTQQEQELIEERGKNTDVTKLQKNIQEQMESDQPSFFLSSAVPIPVSPDRFIEEPESEVTGPGPQGPDTSLQDVDQNLEPGPEPIGTEPETGPETVTQPEAETETQPEQKTDTFVQQQELAFRLPSFEQQTGPVQREEPGTRQQEQQRNQQQTGQEQEQQPPELQSEGFVFEPGLEQEQNTEPGFERRVEPGMEPGPERRPEPEQEEGGDDQGGGGFFEDEAAGSLFGLEFAPSLEARVFDIEDSVDKDKVFTGFEVRPLQSPDEPPV